MIRLSGMSVDIYDSAELCGSAVFYIYKQHHIKYRCLENQIPVVKKTSQTNNYCF